MVSRMSWPRPLTRSTTCSHWDGPETVRLTCRSARFPKIALVETWRQNKPGTMTAQPGATEEGRDQRSMLRHVGRPFCGDPLGVLPREPARSMVAPLANNNLNQSDANLFLCQ